MFNLSRRHTVGAALAAGVLFIVSGSAFAAEQATKLFTIVTEKDETTVALTKQDAALGTDAATIAKALRDRGSLTVWHYAVRKAKDGELEQAPREKISVQAQGVLRVEPYRAPLRVVAAE